MSYTALYRKWRPTSFEEVRGQDHIVKTLKNQINSGRIGHAYLFCGTRGTGKTSIAKIFARAVNCEHPVDGSPCGECSMCRQIAEGASLNVVEIDAASNNGVENIRDIREQVQYPPTDGRYRVYIIDEVHMLSIGAFNALLKTLEEPPSYVIFILATTEVHKIPITILSRCQRYDFKRISIDTIAGRLAELTQAEQIDVDDRALRYVARAADGSMRDALSLLDQCVAFHFGEKLTYDNVLEVLGAVDNRVFSKLFQAVLASDTKACIREIEEMIIQGRDLSQLVNDFVWYMRNLLIAKTTDEPGDMLDMSEENLAVLKEEAAGVDAETLMRYIRIFSELSGQLRYASQKRILVEIAFIKLTTPSMEQNLDSILQRITLLEQKMQEMPDNLQKLASLAPAAGQAASSKTAVVETPPEPKTVSLPPAQYEDLMLMRKEWGRIASLSQLVGSIRLSLPKTSVEPAGEGCLCIVCTDENTFGIINREPELKNLQEVVQEKYKKTLQFKVRLESSAVPQRTVYVSDEDLKNAIHTDVIVEEDDSV
ncbi:MULTISPECIES: DNA polymerase III subunit gamma/tau [Clostridium]|jgi:DNA polymerase-3 subunit gamma/tau|uniref:DNA polymerase III subunit gamma/tau n=1 Tax=Clostridium TaxID=1485 RepID=UPI000E50CAFC|nr:MULTISPECIES: DNA polymerase III subunit gamma/tau [Clostridium]RHO89896.1 DNA polymerase III subunit gamma/tau [Clostridium sp. AF37-7]MCC2171612.1 DNA polymerase III subunit gamma/tau [Clostridium fessum]RHP39258.1 DNA polymerase III subunit gamma/tau [Clostridium sp. AF32-7AC]RHQ64730.1 DNA polymerase III subunit gamma/tau [Clostridium sp. AF24-2LB]RHS69368.1 DNA polymerase III subunit gamma/tau [Clostridium sp. AM43-3BH]